MKPTGLGLTLIGALGISALSVLPACGQTEMEPEDLTVESLSDPGAHWVWINDLAFDHMSDGRAYLVDADSGKFLGMISAGFAHAALQFSPDGDEFYNAETYYARGTRGERTDVLTIYDSSTLAPVDEVILPPKRFMGIPTVGSSHMTDDGRFLMIYNYTPGQSVSVIDLESRNLVGEYDTGGCGLAFSSGVRSFFMLCADGGLMDVKLNEAGEVTSRDWREPFFDVEDDPLTEKPVRVGDIWYFVSFKNVVHPVSVAGGEPEILDTWTLTSAEEFEAGWRIGGIQIMAAHERSGRLYALMHQGGPGSHKNPGTEVWVYDLSKRQRIDRISLDRHATSIAVSQDDDPLLYATMAGDRTLHVIDADSGEMLRGIDELGTTMTFIQSPPLAD